MYDRILYNRRAYITSRHAILLEIFASTRAYW
nr:MAG TPA: hypothetical protein [Caudoviricetes sp.]